MAIFIGKSTQAPSLMKASFRRLVLSEIFKSLYFPCGKSFSNISEEEISSDSFLCQNIP